MITTTTFDGYRGIWYSNQAQDDAYKFKYSGGFATYPQQHIPIAIHAPQARKTFFCYGGLSKDGGVANMVSYFDHATQTVPRPIQVLARRTHDAHHNPTLQIDCSGHLLLFCNCHGTGLESSADDPTHGKSFIFRSREPYSIAAWDMVHESNFSYSQAWTWPDRGLLWLHTRYNSGKRRLFVSTGDGASWSEPQPLAQMALGSYQVSWAEGERVATALDVHPDPGGLNARTNIYYLETRDFGRTWQDAAGRAVSLPLRQPSNPALVHDYAKEGLLVYLKDLCFDAAGHPVLLFITSRGPWSGPASGPREWRTARWTGRAWEILSMGPADHNYDHGSLYIEGAQWRVIAPTEPGPQPGGTGGALTIQASHDQGRSWQMERRLRIESGLNQTYVRRPWHAHPDFYALWADGNAFEPSQSSLYFATRAGRVFRLPRQMQGETEAPEKVSA